MIHSSWGIVCDRMKLVIMGYCLPIYPLTPKNQKKQNFEKMKQITRDIIILHACTKKLNHMRYGSKDTEWNRFFLSFWHIFLLFYLPNNLENQNFEKMKKLYGDVIILHLSNKNHYHIMYASWHMECNRHHFWATFAPPPPKIKIFKKSKKCMEILTFSTCVT